MIPDRLRRPALVVPTLLLLFATIGATSTVSAGSLSTPVASAASGYVKGLWFAGAYEPQVDSRTCVAASTAMMMNILAHRDLNLNQPAILRYAQLRDALNDAVQRGSDPLGWARAATHYSELIGRPTTYAWEAYATEQAALRRAATQIARYGKAVGLLIRHGAHAVVMDGFTASRSPLRGAPWTLYGVSYSDPLGPVHAYVAARYSPLDTYLQLDATPAYDKAWYGKYIVIVPRD
jgi:hypothetical protein